MSVSPLSAVLGEALIKEMSDPESKLALQARAKAELSAISKTQNSNDGSQSPSGYEENSRRHNHREKTDDELLAELNAELTQSAQHESPLHAHSSIASTDHLSSDDMSANNFDSASHLTAQASTTPATRSHSHNTTDENFNDQIGSHGANTITSGSDGGGDGDIVKSTTTQSPKPHTADSLSPEQTKQDLERILKLVVNNVKKQNTPEARFRKKVLASYRWTIEAGAIAEGQGLLYNLKA